MIKGFVGIIDNIYFIVKCIHIKELKKNWNCDKIMNAYYNSNCYRI